MSERNSQAAPPFLEFVLIISLMMSLTALSISAMLPALSQIGQDLQVTNPNDRQLIVSLFFLGMALGQIFFGPLSDRTGRKPAIYGGYLLFFIGAIMSALASNFTIMLVGRLLQGLGISAPRGIALAIVRDRYAGRQMARVMSLAMTVFILIPMVAPAVGQAILSFSTWHGIFVLLILVALVTLLWFMFRLPETLAPENQAPFSLRRITGAMREIARNRTAIGYTISAGLVGGAHQGYLNSAQQIWQEQYVLGGRFALVFAMIALSIGVAFFVNSRLVMRFGMRLLVKGALRFIVVLTVAAIAFSISAAGNPPLGIVVAYLMIAFFAIGLLFGNQNSLAMEPLGHLAGVGAALVGSLSTLLSMLLGTWIGQSYNGTILPVLIGLAVLCGLSIFVVRWADSE